MSALIWMAVYVCAADVNQLETVVKTRMYRSENVTVLSLDPADLEIKPQNESKSEGNGDRGSKAQAPAAVAANSQKPEVGERFHGYKVLRRVEVKDDEVIVRIAESIIEGMKGDIVPAKCFIPRHGIVFRSKEKQLDFVICFECDLFDIYRDDNKTRYVIKDNPVQTLSEVLKKPEKQK